MKLYEILSKQLKSNPDFVTDHGELKKWVVRNKAQNFDAKLIEMLLNNKELKENFFVDVKGTLVFNQNMLVQFLEQKNYLKDSYTAYKNKVGLTIDGKYLKQRNEVALVWPFKDCVLEGGQSLEEQKREEIFFNEILAQDEITQLLEPKILTNAKVYDKDGEHTFGGFTRDAELNQKRGLPANTITDNLIIKGNNLLALHSLKKEFAGKVKLIYIDPPYNTGNDGFGYNDRFNHSSWLTFMKNRLEVARQFLRDDGVIFVQCDDNEQAYLKVLMDEIFERENFVLNIIWRKRGDPPSNKKIASTTEYLLMYGSTIGLNLRTRSEGMGNFDNSDNDPRGEWRHEKLFISNKGGRETASMIYPIINPDNGEKHWPPHNNRWAISKEKAETYLKEGRIVFGKTRPMRKKFKSELREGITWTNLWTTDAHGKFVMNRDGNSEIVNLFGRQIFETSKPEQFIQRAIELATRPDDIVLDYHLGSGTTAAVAHKINRQYIGVEQMDYIEDVAVERLKKVIEGEQGGISKAVNWQGGGAFTYLELKKYNQTFIEQIEEAKSTKALLAIWEQMKAKSFLNYNVDIKKQEEHLEDFKYLSLKEQQQYLCELLDKNQLYVNLSSLHDEDFACTDREKTLTQNFYNIKNK